MRDNTNKLIGSAEENEDMPCESDYVIDGMQISKFGERWYTKFKEWYEIYDIIKAEMEREQFWPNVWTLSDHGNYNLISLESLKKDEIPLNCIECRRYNVKENTCNESASFFDDENLSIGECKFFEKRRVEK